MKDIIGKSINLRDVLVSDAGFILSLRLNKELNKYISSTSPDIKNQEIWIKQYHENPNLQYYYIIENKEGESFGTVRVYDFQKDSFCWGSWLIKKGAPLSFAIESALMVYEFAFNTLGFNRAHLDMRKENLKVVEFHKNFGAKYVSEDELNYYFELRKEDYVFAKNKFPFNKF